MDGLGLVAALVGLWLSLVSIAVAAPLTLPFGWSQDAAAAPQAQQRARAWAKAWSGELEQLLSTPADDDFVETLAMIDAKTPLPPTILTELEPAQRWLDERLSMALGAGASLDFETVELIDGPSPGTTVIRGRGRVDDTVVMIAIAPRGPRHVALVLQVASGQQVLYASIFDAAIAELDGLRAPVLPFPRGSLRLFAIVVWLVAGTIGGIGWTRRSLPRPGARVAGYQVAMGLGAAALVVLIVARVLLSGSAVELSLVDTTPWGLALELAIGGVIMAAVVIGATELWERRLTPVASAPQQGSFRHTGISRRHGGSSSSYGTDPSGAQPVSGTHPVSGAHPISGTHPVVSGPAVTGNTQVGPAPAVTGDTQVGPAPAVTGDTQVGRAPAISGNTKVGPPPTATGEDMSSPPLREIIAGAIEVDTQVGPRPTRMDGEDTRPRARRPILGITGDTTPRGRAPEEIELDDDAPASLVDAHEPDADAPGPRPAGASHSDLFPRVEFDRGPAEDDGHPALDAPLPPRRRS